MGRPKALLEYRGATFLETLIEKFAVRCSPVIVVLGAAADEIRAGTSAEATFVLNPDYAQGQTRSLQCGLRAVPVDAEGVLMTLVDHPAAAPSTLDALLHCGGALHIPRYRGRRGHPIWFSRNLIPEFLALPPDAPASDVVHRHAAEAAFLDLDDPGILADIDDPDAYRALVGASQ